MKSSWDNLEYICMLMVFVLAGSSAIMWYGNGFHTWFWQVITMGWVFNSFLHKKRLDRALKK